MRAHSLLLGLAVLVLLAGSAWADEPVPAEPPVIEEEAPPAPEPPMTAADMEDWIQESPAAVWAMGISKIGAAIVGLLLLILMWIRWERMRAGVIPRPDPVTATMPFSLPATLMILAGTFVALTLAATALRGSQPDEGTGGAAGMLVTQGLLLGAAVFVILRRRRLKAGPQRTPARIALGAFGTFFIASAIVIPTSFLNLLILNLIDYPITLYKPIEEIIRGTGTSTPWGIALGAAALAPVAEESLFRGMLYPAIRSSMKVRHAALLSAVITSSLFALMHPHPPSWLPLFALAMVLTWIFERTNSLAAVIGAHALWNVATLLPLLIRGTS